MDRLELLQSLKTECGVTGSQPSTSVGLTGEMSRLAGWVTDAWNSIQRAHQDWRWMRKSASFATVAGQGTYTLTDIGVNDFRSWVRHSFRNYPTSVGVQGEIFMDWIPYDYWRDAYQYAAFRLTQTRPMQFTETPDRGIGLGPFPADGYTITGDYWATSTSLAADADAPAMPEQFHMAIVYQAMMYYGAYESAQEVYSRGKSEFDRIMTALRMDQLPPIEFGGALA